jgi:signal transduction histidine kinase/ligand-binding sensor domain-containing protein
MLGLAVGAAGPDAHAARDRDLGGGYVIKTWETEEGLPENSANAMVQTPDGHLWIATFNGLVRFNGTTFTVFDPQNTPDLPSGAIANLHLDQGGRLWLGTNRGLVVRQGASWRTLDTAAGSVDRFVRSFAENAGVLLVTFFGGQILRIEGDNATALPAPPGTPGDFIGHVDRTGTIWAGQRGFFGRWDGRQWVASSLAGEVTQNFEGLGTARDGSLWTVSNAHLLRLEGDRILSRRPLPEATGGNWRIYEDGAGAVWLCTVNRGLWKVPAEGPVQRFGLQEGLRHMGIRFAFEDREQNLWFGTSGGGLSRLKRPAFTNHRPATDPNIYAVKAVTEDLAGRIVLGVYGPGLAELDESGRISRRPATTAGRTDGFVQCLLTDRAGRLWVGTYQGGLTLWTGAEPRAISAEESGGESVYALFEDSRGRVWIGGAKTIAVHVDGVFRPFATTAGLNFKEIRCFAEDSVSGDIWAASANGLFRHGAGGWTEIYEAPAQPMHDITCLRAESDGTLWIGGLRHALRRLRAGRLSEVTASQGLPAKTVTAIVDDGLGFWWLGSNRGIVRCDRQDLERAADDPSAVLACQLFNQSDGLVSAECASIFSSTAVKDRGGRLWFATLKGLATTDPATLRLNTVPPPVVIEEFRLEDRARRQRFFQSGGTMVQVAPDTHEIVASFSCLSFVAPEKNRFAWRIDGIDSDWRDLGDRRSVSFFPPAPGTYRLRVKAANNDGVWSRREATVAFVVLPQFWQTVWFRLALAGLTAMGIGAVFQWRVHRVHARSDELHRMNLELEQRVQTRTAELTHRVEEIERLNAELRASQQMTDRAAAGLQEANASLLVANQELEAFSYSVSHDLRAPLRNITGFIELLQKRTAGRLDTEAERFAATVVAETKRMGRLIDDLLTFSRIGRAELQLEAVQLAELVEDVKLELQPDLAHRSVEWRIGPLPPVQGDRTLLRQVVANLLGNAVKFTRRRPAAIIEVGVHPGAPGESMVLFFVRDNGAGFNPKYLDKLFRVFQRLHTARDFEGTGIGLANVKRIITRHGGRVWAEGRLDNGATFYFTLRRLPESS